MALGLLVSMMAGPAAADDAGGKGIKALVGTWTLVSVDNGKEPKQMEGFRFIISEKSIEMRAPNGAMKNMGIITRLDPTAQPSQIDLKNGAATGLGIYELSGDVLKLVVRDPSQERPREFKGTPQGILFLLRREKE
jgi:uncharacterized protein (TIGR03067 family)